MNDMAGKYLVGYGKPPAEHRFRKGQSGNPKGRPRGSRNKASRVDTGFGMRAAEEFLKIEAYRLVTIREGENLVEMPAIQAVFRAMGVAALKGNRFVQKQLTEMLVRMEEEHHQSRLELFEKALDYKQTWDSAIERARELGNPEPTPIPHPDDIILDPDNGGVRIIGPQTKEQKQRLDLALERRAQAQEEVTYFAKKYRLARSEKMKALWLEEWHFEQRIFDIINDVLQGRYKARLENRSFHEGASQEGKALEELRRNQTLREEYIR